MAGEITLRELSPKLREFIEQSAGSNSGGGSINANIKTCGFTATQGQTTFEIPYDNYIADECYLDVKVNSIWVSPNEYTVNGKEVTFSSALEAGTEVFFTVYLVGATAVERVNADVVVENEQKQFVTAQERNKVSELDDRGFLTTKWNENVDANTVIENGIYRANGWEADKNYPANKIGTMLVTRMGDSIGQLFMADTGEVFYRSRNADNPLSWTEWKQFATLEELKSKFNTTGGDINGGTFIKSGSLGVGGGNSLSTSLDRCIQIGTNATYGDANTSNHDNHTGYMITSTMPNGWGSAKLQFHVSTDWHQYKESPTFTISNSAIYHNQDRLLTATDMATTVRDVATYKSGLIADDQRNPDNILEPFVLTSHTNNPTNTFWFIRNYFYDGRSATNARTQVAIPYKNSSAGMYIRHFDDSVSVWSSWYPLGGMLESPLSFLNGWGYGATNVGDKKVRKSGNVVTLNTLIRGGSLGGNISIATIPASFAPKEIMVFRGEYYQTDNYCNLVIEPNGVIRTSSFLPPSSTDEILINISYITD